MDRSEALREVQKATIDTADAAGGMLSPSQSSQFITRVGEATDFSKLVKVERRTSATGTLNKMYGARRIIRKADENSDDGYRAAVTFPTVPYAAQKVRLPWEVTEDVFHENIEGQNLEAKVVAEMEQAFGEDFEDLDFNGDTTSGDPFLNINDGILKQLVDNAGSTHRVNGGLINSGNLSKAHLFAAKRALPNRYRRDTGLVWAMSPNKADTWTEYLTDRTTAAGDLALLGSGDQVDKPLRIPIVVVPSMPDSRILLLNPKNVVPVVTWDVRRRKVTGETDKSLAATDKRFYVFFVKRDIVIQEFDAVADVYGLA